MSWSNIYASESLKAFQSLSEDSQNSVTEIVMIALALSHPTGKTKLSDRKLVSPDILQCSLRPAFFQHKH